MIASPKSQPSDPNCLERIGEDAGGRLGQAGDELIGDAGQWRVGRRSYGRARRQTIGTDDLDVTAAERPVRRGGDDVVDQRDTRGDRARGRG